MGPGVVASCNYPEESRAAAAAATAATTQGFRTSMWAA
jgi:hypothetical protein